MAVPKDDKIIMQGRLKKFMDGAFFGAGALATLLLCVGLLRAYGPGSDADAAALADWRTRTTTRTPRTPGPTPGAQAAEDPAWENGPDDFYADADFGYGMGSVPENWDAKRTRWLRAHPNVRNYTDGGNPRIFLISGSQAAKCQNPMGDHLMLRSLKNKQDYCRLHGLDMIHNMLLLDARMYGFWSKIPIVRAAMLAHPEAEWIWWMDSDAVVTDMEYEHPMERYAGYNLVLHGWRHKVYQERSWLGINAGVFLIRNCEWSLRFMERWARMSPLAPDFPAWAQRLSHLLRDRAVVESDDQSALVYLMITEDGRWGDKIYIENAYEFQGFWKVFVAGYENGSRTADADDAACAGARRRYAEKSVPRYWAARRRCGVDGGKSRPFVTHFAGCQPCTGWRNPIYGAEECYGGMERALDFADDQVMRFYGFRRRPYRYPSTDMVPFVFGNGSNSSSSSNDSS